MDTFSVGEIAILNRPESKYHGNEVEILSPLRRSRLWSNGDYEICACHVVRVDGLTEKAKHGDWAVEPKYLRKKRPPPPREDVGSWDLCPWQPAKVVA